MSKPVCVVLGVGPGISLSVARRFAREGFSLALIARNPEKVQQYAEELRAAGYDSRAYTADAADFASISSVFSQIHAQQGLTEVLVYNAVTVRRGLPSEVDADLLLSDFKVNVAGALAAAQQVIPHMKMQRKGTILFTGGGLALEPSAIYASLAVGKAGIRSLCFSLADELSVYDIHVATVTITGLVKPGTRFDPDVIAESYWRLYQQKPHSFEREIIYR
jgi:short-subunit dehydrogenase